MKGFAGQFVFWPSITLSATSLTAWDLDIISNWTTSINDNDDIVLEIWRTCGYVKMNLFLFLNNSYSIY